MSEDTDMHPPTSGAQDAPIDWSRIERSPEFRDLTARRHRFLAIASVVTFGGFLVYLCLATFATELMGTTVGGVPIAWLAAMSQVLLTWAVTWSYLRRADREFAPLAQRVAGPTTGRFARDRDAAETARAASTPSGRRTR
jgi:uncharacterized membrane protein (DUF485 family)